MLMVCATTHANNVLANEISTGDSYVKVKLGSNFSGKLSNISATEDLGYATATPNRHPNTQLSSVAESTSFPDFSVAFGRTLQSVQNFGYEVGVRYSKLTMPRQFVTLSNPSFVPIYGQNNFTEDQRALDAKLFQISLSGLYRFADAKSQYSPYLGAGVTYNRINVTGTGASCFLVQPVVTTGCGFNLSVNTTSFSFGGQLRAGLDYSLTEDYKLGFEYAFDYIPAKFDQIRSIYNVSGTQTLHAVGVTLTKGF